MDREALRASLYTEMIRQLGPNVDRTYLLDALLPLIDAALADAWAEGYDACIEDQVSTTPNPYGDPAGSTAADRTAT